MIRAKRRGPFRGVWRLVGPDGEPVTDRIWFDEARARRAAQRKRAERRQTTLKL